MKRHGAIVQDMLSHLQKELFSKIKYTKRSLLHTTSESLNSIIINIMAILSQMKHHAYRL